MTLIAINADWIVNIMFGHKWDGAIPIIEVLAFAGAIQSISQPASVVFKSIGKPEIGIYLALIRTLLLVTAILLGVLWGNIITVAYLVLVAKLISLIMVLLIIRYFIPYRLLDLIQPFKGPLINITTLALMHRGAGAGAGDRQSPARWWPRDTSRRRDRGRSRCLWRHGVSGALPGPDPARIRGQGLHRSAGAGLARGR